MKHPMKKYLCLILALLLVALSACAKSTPETPAAEQTPEAASSQPAQTPDAPAPEPGVETEDAGDGETGKQRIRRSLQDSLTQEKKQQPKLRSQQGEFTEMGGLPDDMIRDPVRAENGIQQRLDPAQERQAHGL